MLQQSTRTCIRRTGKALDVERLGDLFAHAFRRQADPYRPWQVAAALEAGLGRAPELFASGHGLVAMLGGDIVGTVAWSFGPKPPHPAIPEPFDARWKAPVATIHSFCVAPEVAGRGIGRQLLEQVLIHAAADGGATFALNATLCALSFYQRCGFRIHAEREAMLGGVVFPYVQMVRAGLQGWAR